MKKDTRSFSASNDRMNGETTPIVTISGSDQSTARPAGRFSVSKALSTDSGGGGEDRKAVDKRMLLESEEGSPSHYGAMPADAAQQDPGRLVRGAAG